MCSTFLLKISATILPILISLVVRLWSLHTFTNLVVYKGHNYPVWTVKFRYTFLCCQHDSIFTYDFHQREGFTEAASSVSCCVMIFYGLK